MRRTCLLNIIGYQTQMFLAEEAERFLFQLEDECTKQLDPRFCKFFGPIEAQLRRQLCQTLAQCKRSRAERGIARVSAYFSRYS